MINTPQISVSLKQLTIDTIRSNNVGVEHAFFKMQVYGNVIRYISSGDFINAIKEALSIGSLIYLKEAFTKSNYSKIVYWREGLLYWACLGGYPKLIKYIINEDAAIDWNRGLLAACKSSKIDAAKILLESHSKHILDEGNEDYWGDIVVEICENGFIDIVELILIYFKDELNFELGLQTACEFGHIDVVKLMLDLLRNKDVYEYEQCFSDAFTISASNGHINIINLLIREGGKIDDLDPDDLYYACICGNNDIVELFISNGINNFDVGLKGACEGGHKEISNLMINKGASFFDDCIVSAATGGNVEIFRSILDLSNSKDINKYKNYLHESLIEASTCGHMNIIKLLIQEGVEINKLSPSFLGNACKSGNKDIVELFIANGVNDFDSGLVSACYENQEEIAKLMIEKGATNFNNALLSVRSVKIAELIIKAGANNLNDALLNAAYSSYFELFKFYIEKGANNIDTVLEKVNKFERCSLLIKYIEDVHKQQ